MHRGYSDENLVAVATSADAEQDLEKKGAGATLSQHAIRQQVAASKEPRNIGNNYVYEKDTCNSLSERTRNFFYQDFVNDDKPLYMGMSLGARGASNSNVPTKAKISITKYESLSHKLPNARPTIRRKNISNNYVYEKDIKDMSDSISNNTTMQNSYLMSETTLGREKTVQRQADASKSTKNFISTRGFPINVPNRGTIPTTATQMQANVGKTLKLKDNHLLDSIFGARRLSLINASQRNARKTYIPCQENAGT